MKRRRRWRWSGRWRKPTGPATSASCARCWAGQPVGLLPAVSATVRLDGWAGAAWLLVRVRDELGRRHRLDPLVRHTGVAATYTVRLRRRAGTPAGG